MAHYLIFVLAYLLGAIPFAYLAGKHKKMDIREHGSGNMGTSNAFRVLGKSYGMIVLIGDTLKGALAASLCLWLVGPWGAIAGGLLAVAGHSWNPFFAFKPSGKGVAAAFGVILVLMPNITLIALAFFGVAALLSRYVSLASCTAALTVMICVWIFPEPLAYRVFCLLAGGIVLLRHQGNIRRMLNGTENRIHVRFWKHM
jgi:glycerol-3-phosphate acyltransferase PlsY